MAPVHPLTGVEHLYRYRPLLSQCAHTYNGRPPPVVLVSHTILIEVSGRLAFVRACCVCSECKKMLRERRTLIWLPMAKLAIGQKHRRNNSAASEIRSGMPQISSKRHNVIAATWTASLELFSVLGELCLCYLLKVHHIENIKYYTFIFCFNRRAAIRSIKRTFQVPSARTSK